MPLKDRHCFTHDSELAALIEGARANPGDRFPVPLEERYADDTKIDRRAEIALHGRLGPVIYGLFFFLDLITVPDCIGLAAAVRGTCLLGGLILIEVLTHGTPKRIVEDLLGPITTFCALVGISLIFLRTNAPDKLLYLNGVLLVTVYGNLCMPGRFRFKLAANPAYFLLLLGAVSLKSLPLQDALAQLLMLATGQILTLTVVHRAEIQTRRTYLLGLREQLRAEALAVRNDHLQTLTERDALTSLLNRRGLDALLPQLVAEAVRTRSPLGLVMIDVDHFKAFNDLYGHQAGDECLRTVAAILSAYTRREMDHVGRYGGEEFVAILPDRDLAGAIGAAERLRRAIDAADIPHEAEGTVGRVTASFGVACVSAGSSMSAEALVQAADRALYAAKSAGRNRVVPSPLFAMPQPAALSM